MFHIQDGSGADFDCRQPRQYLLVLGSVNTKRFQEIKQLVFASVFINAFWRFRVASCCRLSCVAVSNGMRTSCCWLCSIAVSKGMCLVGPVSF